MDEGMPNPPRPRRRWILRATVAIVLLAVGGELFARFYLGLGDPPLSQADPQIEYLFKPNQDCRRFGNRIKYNQYSMRSEDFPAHKSRPDELRVLVIGDSVVNGGVMTDQSQLATTLLEQKLAADLKRPVVVGNISAGSWGPPNELAYLKRYGLFDADVVVIVLSSHDYVDVPTFEPVVGVHPSYPDHRPLLALWDGFQRYVLPRIKGMAVPNEGLAPATGPAKPADVEACMTALREMIALARAGGAKVIVAQHLTRSETLASPQAGHEAIAQEARRDGVTPVELGVAFESARRRGEDPYRPGDDIHPSVVGQREIAGALLPAIETAVR
jgi:lysophospholipase L1-like esterase